jgi:transcriptional regulator with XRE-family HTH domain
MPDACSNCGAPTESVRGDYRFEETGLPVLLKNIELIRCGRCGNVDPVIPRMSRVFQVIALALIRKKHPLKGREIEFLRTHVGLSRNEFASLLHAEPAALERWENDQERAGAQTDRLIRALALLLGEGLQEAGDSARAFVEIQDQPRELAIEIDPATMHYRYAA